MKLLAILIIALTIPCAFANNTAGSNFSLKFSESSDYGDAISSRISNDGKIMVSTGNPSDSTYGRDHVFLLIHDIESNKEICRDYIGKDVSAKVLGFSQDNKKVFLASTTSFSPYGWAISSYSVENCLSNDYVGLIKHSGSWPRFTPESIMISPNNDYISVRMERRSGTYIFDLNLQDRVSFSCVDGFLSPDGSKLLCFNYGSASNPIALKIYDPKDEFNQTSMIKSSGYNFQKYFFSKNSDGVFYTLADSYPTYYLNLHYFDVDSQQDTILTSNIDKNVSDEALSPKNKFYVFGYLNKGLKIIDLQTKKVKDTEVIQGQLNDFSFSSDEKYVAASVYEPLDNGVYSQSNRIVVFELASGKVVKIVSENSKVFDSYFVPNKNQLVLKLDAEGILKVIDL